MAMLDRQAVQGKVRRRPAEPLSQGSLGVGSQYMPADFWARELCLRRMAPRTYLLGSNNLWHIGRLRAFSSLSSVANRQAT